MELLKLRHSRVVFGVLGVAVAAPVIWFIMDEPSGRPTDAEAEVPAAGSGSGVLDEASAEITISGDAEGLISPGNMAVLDLTMANPNDVGITITEVTVEVTGVDAPNADDSNLPCTLADFAVRPLRSGVELDLPAQSTTDLSDLRLPRAQWPAVAMLNRRANQDGCKGATIALRYEARGVHR